MFSFWLKLVLIVLLNETCAYATQDTQTILLPAWKPTVANNVRMFYCACVILLIILFIYFYSKYIINKFLSLFFVIQLANITAF